MKISKSWWLCALVSCGCAVCNLKVVNGSGSGKYKPITSIPVVADTAPMGTAFANWSGDTAGIIDKTKPDTVIRLYQLNTTITAAYTNITAAYTNISPVWPMPLGAWGGRPSCVLDGKNQLHVIVDSGSPSRQLAVYDVAGAKVTSAIIDVTKWNSKTIQLFNPSQVILADDTQVITVWWFAARTPAGCIPRVLYRSKASTVPGTWQDLIVDPSRLDWQPAKLCTLGNTKVVDFGFMNNYFELSMVSGKLTLGTFGNYSSPRGGGEKEARDILPDGTFHVANSGCAVNTGAYYRNSKSCNSGIRWADYLTYKRMGNDDSGHCAVAGDLTNSAIGYMFASWDSGLVYNIWDGSKLSYSITNLPVIDKHGYSGLYKYPLAVASCPGGGAYIVWTSGAQLYLGLVHADGKVAVRDLGPGYIGTLCVGLDGVVHIVYNLSGKIMYRQVKW